MLAKAVKLNMTDKLVNLVSTGSAFPNAKSGQDRVIDGIKFITRYVYAGKISSNSRAFCRNMINAVKIYRKEDILSMSDKIVNQTYINKEGKRKGLGPYGSTFVKVWFYNAGGSCHHRWNKQVYVAFEGTGIDVKSPKARQIAGAKAAKYGYVIKNPKLVSERPIDMKNRGFLPSNKRQ